MLPIWVSCHERRLSAARSILQLLRHFLLHQYCFPFRIMQTSSR